MLLSQSICTLNILITSSHVSTFQPSDMPPILARLTSFSLMKSLPALVSSYIRFCNLLLSFCPTLPYQPQLLLIPRHCTETPLDNDQPYRCVAITPERQTYLALPVALLETSQDDISQPRRAIGRQVLSFLRLLRFDFYNMYLNYVRDCLMYCFSIHSIRNMVAGRHWFSMDSLDCQYHPSGSWTMDFRGRPSIQSWIQ